jgi:hypothetical protein
MMTMRRSFKEFERILGKEALWRPCLGSIKTSVSLIHEVFTRNTAFVGA